MASTSPIIVDRTPPIPGVVNDGLLYGVDSLYTKDDNKVGKFSFPPA